MNNVEKFKEITDKWLEDNKKYVVKERRVINNPVRKGLMTFNTSFSDREKSIEYSVIGFENETGKCGMHIEAMLYTGIDKDIEEETEYKGYALHVRNNGTGKEALVKLTHWIDDMESFNFSTALDAVVEEGIQRLIY